MSSTNTALEQFGDFMRQHWGWMLSVGVAIIAIPKAIRRIISAAAKALRILDNTDRFITVPDAIEEVRREIALYRNESRVVAAEVTIIVEALKMAIFVTTPEGRCTTVNAYWQSLTGMTEAEALGTGWLTAIHPDDREIVRREWDARMSREETFDMDYRYQNIRTGVAVRVHCRTIQVRDAVHHIVNLVGIVKERPPKTLLVVDNDPGIRELAKRLTVGSEYETTTAATLKEAVELMERKTFDMALVDLDLDDSAPENTKAAMEAFKLAHPVQKIMLFSGAVKDVNSWLTFRDKFDLFQHPKAFIDHVESTPK